MPAPAAQFSPALPWAAGTRGTITLQEPVSKEDLLNGALTFVGVNRYLYQPEGSDGYVDYLDEDDKQALSIAIDDDETKNVLVAGVAQDAEVQRVVVGPAVGRIRSWSFRNENMQPLAVGESGFVVLECNKDGNEQYCLVSQDGKTALTCKRVADSGEQQWFELLDRETPVTVIRTLKLPSAMPGGALAELPKVLCEIASFNNDAHIKVLHAPALQWDEGASAAPLYTSPSSQTSWGDQVTTLMTKNVFI